MERAALPECPAEPNVPFAYTLNQSDGDHLLVCMQDIDDTTRPTSLEPITDLALEREAAGLASIHAANFAQASVLAWLPKVDRSYLEEMLFERTWRPAWEQALASWAFVETFQSAIPRVGWRGTRGKPGGLPRERCGAGMA